jgi:hypothetical protein
LAPSLISWKFEQFLMGSYWREQPKLSRPRWRRRAEIAAPLFEPGWHVLDLGCGEMALRDYLPGSCAYTPADVNPASAEILKVDLDNGDLPDGRYDVVALLGVIEYLDRPKQALTSIHQLAPRLITSYTNGLLDPAGHEANGQEAGPPQLFFSRDHSQHALRCGLEDPKNGYHRQVIAAATRHHGV